jgi:sporulation protein YqfC
MGLQGKGWKEKVARALEFPADVLLDIPRIIVDGNTRLTIENHGGIMEYSMEQVRVRVRNGEVTIKGSKLVIVAIFQEGMEIEGRISGIDFLM